MRTPNERLRARYDRNLARVVKALRDAADLIETDGRPYSGTHAEGQWHMQPAMSVAGAVMRLYDNADVAALLNSAHDADMNWETEPDPAVTPITTTNGS